MRRDLIGMLLASAALPASASLAQTQPTADVATGDIVVTAQKFEQRLQDVPLAVSAVDGDALTEYGATRLQDIALSVPTLQLDSTFGVPGSASITLRGITTGNQASSTVATYIDDVPIGSSASFAAGNIVGFDLFPYDLDHVEVLGGPQGTLYGASSLGGLVKYVTRTPSLTDTSVKFGGEALTIDRASKAGWTARGAANVVLTPGELAVGISATHQYTPGYIDNPLTGGKNVNHGEQDAVRAVFHWKPADRLTVKLSGLYNRSKFADIGLVTTDATGTPLFGDFTYASAQPNRQLSTTRLASLVADYELGAATLTSVTSFSNFHTSSSIDGSPVFNALFGVDAAFVSDVRVKKFTEELRLASSSDGPFTWLIGGFYTREKSRYGQVGLGLVRGTQAPAPAPFDLLIDGLIPSRYREWALFANGTFEITPAWDVSAGARYSRNRQVISETISGALVGAPVSLTNRRSSDGAFTFTLGTSYHLNSDAMLYARIASGYRPGGPNFVVPGFPVDYDPDTLTNYEVGLKSQLLDRRLTVNLSAFYIDWKDIQLQGRTPTNLAYVANGGKARSRGVEATGNLKVFPGLTLGGAVAYTSGKLKDDAPQARGFDGDRLPVTARWAGSATANYDFSVSGSTDAHLGIAWRYTGPRNQFFPADPNNHRLKSYDVINATAGLSFGSIDVNLYVRNLANSKAITSWLYVGGPAVLQPRTIGLSADVKL